MTGGHRLSSHVRALVAAAALACAAPLAHANVYALVEEDGTVRFSNTPDDPRYQLFRREPAGYELRDPADVRGVRNPGDMRLRAAWGRADPKSRLFANPLLADRPYQGEIVQAAKAHQVDPALVHAVIAVESNYNPHARSDKGAVGLMQVMPDTGRRYGVQEKELRHPATNIRAGVQYLAELIDLFDGDLKLALAGYNAGENAVLRHGRRIPPFAETQAYVPRVLRFYDALRVR
ncbi:MAG: lytic transglycosylase domain-containing protein [Burkholderiales bacterium]